MSQPPAGVVAIERWNHTHLYALEGLAQQFQAAKRHLEALQAALAAISIDPYRETAHRLVVEIHLAEGNNASALKRYRHYRALLQRERDVEPSPYMTGLIKDLTSTHEGPCDA